MQKGIDLADHVQVALNQNFTEYDGDNDSRVQFLRVEVTNVKPAVRSIVKAIADISWMNGLADDLIREGLLARAQPTIDKLSRNLTEAIENDATNDVGEYIVSMVARYIIEAIYGYRALPLAEVIKEQKSGNPGFDYHHEKDSLILIFGEAKYQAGRNAYGSAFSQIVKHIKKQKDLKEIPDLINFMSEDAKLSLGAGKKGYSAAFSTSGKSFDDAQLIKGIKANVEFNQLLEHEALLIVAVDIHD